MTLRKTICVDVSNGVNIQEPRYTGRDRYKQTMCTQVMRIVQALLISHINDNDKSINYENIKNRLPETDSEKTVKTTLRYLEESNWTAKSHIERIKKRNAKLWKN